MTEPLDGWIEEIDRSLHLIKVNELDELKLDFQRVELESLQSLLLELREARERVKELEQREAKYP